MQKRYSQLRTTTLITAALCAIGTGAFAQTTLQLGHTGAASHHFQQVSEEFARLVDERTGGEVQVTIYPSDQLGGQMQLVEGTFLGTNDMVLTSDAVLSNFVPEVGVINLPFLFRDYDHVRAVLDGSIGDQLGEAVEGQGAILVGWWENGFRHVTNSRGPVENPEDLAGMKIRVPEGPVFVDTFNQLGASATPVAFSELYSALQLGVVDGQENPPAHILTQRFYEVQDYASRTGHIYLSSPVLISSSAYGRLTEDQQQILLETGKELASFHTNLVREEEAAQWEEIEAAGMAVNDVDPEAFVEATAPVIEKYGDVFGAELIQQIRETR